MLLVRVASAASGARSPGPSTRGGAGRRSRRRPARGRSSASAPRARSRAAAARDPARASAAVNSGAVDDVAAVARQRHAVARLGVGRARLGVLAGHAADAHDRLLAGRAPAPGSSAAGSSASCAIVSGLAVGEALGAVAALQQEALAALRRGDAARAAPRSPTTPRSAAGGDSCRHHALERLRIRVAGCCWAGLRLPARRVPVVDCGARSHGRIVHTHLIAPQKADGASGHH